jgi:hypothetical protein
MSHLKVEINYHAIATLSQGIKSQIEREDWNGVRGSVALLCKQLDKAVVDSTKKETWFDSWFKRRFKC